jgi:hypothetical protein
LIGGEEDKSSGLRGFQVKGHDALKLLPRVFRVLLGSWESVFLRVHEVVLCGFGDGLAFEFESDTIPASEIG